MNITQPAPRQRDQSIGRSTTTGSRHAARVQGAPHHAESPHSHCQCRTGFPAIMGPERDMKEVYILSGLVGFLAVVVAAFWYYSQADEAAHTNRSAEALNSAQVSRFSKIRPSRDRSRCHFRPAEWRQPLASRSTDIPHDDIAFEVGRKGLTDDGKAALQRHAEFLKSEPDWGVLVQGYTDQQGSKSFNKILD